MTGCLQRASGATSGATGTTGTTGTSSSSESGFILANASMSGSSGAYSSGGATGAATGTAGATTPSSAATSGTTYHLDADSSKLSPHVGHKVEITGKLDDKDKSSSTTSSSTSTSTSSSSSSSMSSGPKLKVDTVRMIASSCTE